MAELITIDKDALVRAIYSNTDASEVEARSIVNTVAAPPPAGERQAVADPWIAAIDEALIANCLDCTGPNDDPAKTLARLIGWEVQVALDPAVSQAAASLIEQGKVLAAPAAAPEPRDEALLKLSQFAHTAAHMGEHDMRNNLADIADQLIALAATPAPEAAPGHFQARVKPWLLECFGEVIASDREERNHRFLEEALELVQACGCTASEAHQLVDYTFGRPAGEKGQEVGGVMVTLAALCLARDLEMHLEGETELARISAPEIVARIRAKQAAKPKHSPLPEAASMRMCECGKLPHEDSYSWEWPNQRQAAPVQDADWRFVTTYADTEVRSTTDDKLLAVIHAGPDQQRIVRALKGLTPSGCNHG